MSEQKEEAKHVMEEKEDKETLHEKTPSLVVNMTCFHTKALSNHGVCVGSRDYWTMVGARRGAVARTSGERAFWALSTRAAYLEVVGAPM